MQKKRLLTRAVSGLCSHQKFKPTHSATFFLLKTYLSGRETINANLLTEAVWL